MGLAKLNRTPLRWLFWPAARRFAKMVCEFDRRVGTDTLALASHWLLTKMSGGLQVFGSTQVPSTGAVLILSNHPGMTDTVALFASLAARPDLMVIAMDRPFLRALPHVARHLIFVPDSEAGRLAVVRAGTRHLKQGGVLLTFPAGKIEADPAAFGMDMAVVTLKSWSTSHEVFARFVPHARLLPVIVSQVISHKALAHPLTRLRRRQQDKEMLAASLQVMFSTWHKLPVKVSFGMAVPASTAGAARVDSIVDQAAQLIASSCAPACATPEMPHVKPAH